MAFSLTQRCAALQIHGKGVLMYANGNRYEGEWENDVINGHGTLFYADGDKYEGQWSQGKMHGTGTYTYADGDQYTGEWCDDQRHGESCPNTQLASATRDVCVRRAVLTADHPCRPWYCNLRGG